MTRDDDIDPSDAPLFSRPLLADDVPEEGLETKIVASPQEREALADADGLGALSRLEADLCVTREGRDGLRVTGELRADLRQTCVLTLEPFDSRIVAPIEMRFAPERAPTPPPSERASRRRKEAVKVDEEESQPRSHHAADLDADPPDPMIDGQIDLGEIVAEFLALAIDLYPRKPGAQFVAPAEEDEDAPARTSPFAALRDALGKDRRS
jgi:hypothetical protein